MNHQEIENTRRTISGLCKLARELGYKDPYHQLHNSDGSVVGDLLCFLEDNPGACEAIIEWVIDEYAEEDEEEDEEEVVEDETGEK